MKIAPKQYAESLYDSVSDKPKNEIKKVIEGFARILISNNDISKLDKIIEQFSLIWKKEGGIVEAEIKSARELDKQVVKLLNNYIASLSGAKKVEVKEQVDKNILGGLVIKYNDKVLDGSLKTRIKELKKVISN